MKRLRSAKGRTDSKTRLTRPRGGLIVRLTRKHLTAGSRLAFELRRSLQPGMLDAHFLLVGRDLVFLQQRKLDFIVAVQKHIA
jgi:hypothetical protein